MPVQNTVLFRQQAFIDGEWVHADSGQVITVSNPATGETVGTVPRMGATETCRAIEAANRALPAWRSLTAKERAVKLRRWFELMMANQEALARLMTVARKGLGRYRGSYGRYFHPLDDDKLQRVAS
ncbi:aldehyde dehydrogenase family protein [Pseudomonas cavernicola]|uniref:Aldehyde dehydrogenase family protein n=1 Tax=Pseudomonas cavernicola TaxID=2320866 RepID=A0A418XF45_9PSED|nr:aldehyde dehydrogenase family protein [Pseudomonas cavernicola]